VRAKFQATIAAAALTAQSRGRRRPPVSGQPQATRAAAPSDTLRLPFETFTLPNGLTVILSPDKTTPTVAVNVWYKVGSKNQVVGRTGFGDRSVIEAPLKATGLAPIAVYDIEGNPLSTQ
jgi:zinc protease